MEQYTILANNIPPAPIGEQKYIMKPKDYVFAALTILSSVIMSIFGIWGGFAGGFGVSLICLILSFSFYLLGKGRKIKIFPLICGILSLGMAVSFITTSNGGVLFWSVAVMFFLCLSWYTSLANGEESKGDLGILVTILPHFFRGAFKKMPLAVGSLFTVKSENRKKVGMVFLGLGIAFPILCVIIPLLVSSDLAFKGFVKVITENVFLNFFKGVFGFGLATFFLGYGFYLRKRELPAPKKSEFKGFDNIILISSLSAISLCYLAYLFSQLAYFFSAFKGFLPENYDFTLSSYARRGFFEMCAIAGINFVIIFAAVLLSRKKNEKVNPVLKTICLFIGLFTILVIATALSKMFLYIGELGMTRLRITTTAFMIFLTVVFLALMFRMFVKKISVLKIGLVTAGIVLVILGSVNVNTIVADYNYEAYKSGNLKEMDIETIYELGEEGVPYIINLAKYAKNDQVRNDAKEYVRDVIEDLYETSWKIDGAYEVLKVKERKYDNIYEMNIPRARAYEILDEYMEKHHEILTREIYELEYEDELEYYEY